MKTVSTPKGTILPLTNLKNKDYLMVAYRIQWLNEEVANFDIQTEFLLLTEEQTIARATVTLLDKDGKVVKKAQATKRETKKDFSDHTEKAETSSIGRAISLLGFGTQFALADLDEGERIVDSPLQDVKTTQQSQNTKLESKQEQPQQATTETKKSSFKKPNTQQTKPNQTEQSTTDGWD